MGEAQGVCQDFIECEESLGESRGIPHLPKPGRCGAPPFRASGKVFDRSFHRLSNSE
jgi:hypothetical protein